MFMREALIAVRGNMSNTGRAGRLTKATNHPRWMRDRIVCKKRIITPTLCARLPDSPRSPPRRRRGCSRATPAWLPAPSLRPTHRRRPQRRCGPLPTLSTRPEKAVRRAGTGYPVRVSHQTHPTLSTPPRLPSRELSAAKLRPDPGPADTWIRREPPRPLTERSHPTDLISIVFSPPAFTR